MKCKCEALFLEETGVKFDGVEYCGRDCDALEEAKRKALASRLNGGPTRGGNGRSKVPSAARQVAQAELDAIAARTLAGRNGNGQEPAPEAEQVAEQVSVDPVKVLEGLKFDPKRPNVGKAARQKAAAQLGISEAVLLVRMGYTQPQPEQVVKAEAQLKSEQPTTEAKAQQVKRDNDKGSRKERIAAEQARRTALAAQQAA